MHPVGPVAAPGADEAGERFGRVRTDAGVVVQVQDPDVVAGLALVQAQLVGVVVRARLEAGAPRRAVVVGHGDDPYPRVRGGEPPDVGDACGSFVDDDVDAQVREPRRQVLAARPHDPCQAAEGVHPRDRRYRNDQQVGHRRGGAGTGRHAGPSERHHQAHESLRHDEDRYGPADRREHRQRVEIGGRAAPDEPDAGEREAEADQGHPAGPPRSA
jgi:hypothetical protein